jgi:flagellar basal body-associated protein FliL
MNCSSCGSNLPPGAAVCPVCGVPTPYNVSGGSQQYQPTVPASSYGSPQPSNDPTYISSPYGAPSQQPIPSTSYGPQSYDPSQQNPYGSAPANPYGAPANPYGTAVPQDPYSAPAMQPQAYPGGFPPAGQPPKRKSRVGLIIGIIVGVIVLICAGLGISIYAAVNSGVSSVDTRLTATAATVTAAAQTTTTPPPSSASPSGSPVVPSAAAILNSLKMASAIDNNFNPTKLSTTFTTNQKVYVTYSINTGGQTGCGLSKWYLNGKLDSTSTPLKIQANFDHGFFSNPGFANAGNGAVELYWGIKADCSDAQLASFTAFTVTGTSSHTTGQPLGISMEMDRRL